MPVGTHVVIRGQQNPGVIKEVDRTIDTAVVEFRLPLDDLEEAPLAEATERAIPRGPTPTPSVNWGSHEETRHLFNRSWAAAIPLTGTQAPLARPQMKWGTGSLIEYYVSSPPRFFPQTVAAQKFQDEFTH